jgi:hypothetical protein
MALHETDRCFQRHREEREAADLMGRLERMRQNRKLRSLER